MTDLGSGKRRILQSEPYVCAMCGNCTLVCPIFRQMKWEPYGSRGKLRLMKSIIEGEVDFDQEYVDRIFQCTLCNHCTLVCTTSIHLDKYWELVRAEAKSRGLLPAPVDFVHKATIEYDDPYSMGSLYRLLWTEGLEIDVSINEQSNTAYFVGCNAALNSELHDIPRSMIRIMDHANYDYTILGEDEVCCGLPLLWSGDSKAANEMVLRNFQKMRELEVRRIIFSCPSCIVQWQTAYLRKYLRPIETEFELLTASQFIQNLIADGRLSFSEQANITATYHDPCVSARVLRVIDPPREIIEYIPGVYKVETMPSKENTRCCGSHALLNVVDPVLSSEIGEMRLREVSVTPATLLVTDCPRCVRAFNLAKMIMGYKIEILDITQLVAGSLDKPKDGGTERLQQ